MATARLALILLLTCSASVRAEPDETAESNEVPVVGRPSDLPFSEASGWFEVRARAEPTTLQAETPLTFTVSVRAVRAARRPPQRIDLHQLPDFAEQFYLEDTTEEMTRPDDRTWEFAYRLKPRRPEVRDIPSLPFVYFNPYLLTVGKGFQVVYTDPIPLRVLPHETVQIPVQAPERAFVLATGPAVLERRTPWTPPGVAAMLLLLLTPPLACVVWYLIWRRLYPDAARLASQRRSRAARQALHALHAARRLDVETRAERTAAIVVGYLQQRMDLSIAEPTPREVGLLFAQHGCSPALIEQAVRFFDACDAARFLPADESASFNLHASANQLVLTVEEATAVDKVNTVNRQDAKIAKEDKKRQFNSFFFSLSSLGVLGVLAVRSLSLAAMSTSPTLSDGEIQQRAEMSFQEGVRLRQSAEQARPHFRDAAGYFDELAKRGVRNALLYRNLGNAHLLADDLPRALLSYHRGLRLSPNDSALRASLAEARERVVYPQSGNLGRPRSEDRPPWLPHVRSAWLMFASITCYVLGCVAVTRWRMMRRGRLLGRGVIGLLAAVVLSGWLLVRAEEKRQRDAHPLVVIARDGVLLRRGNSLVFPPRYDTPIHRGVEGRLLFERGGWMQIELSGGEIGWLPSASVVVDTPSPRAVAGEKPPVWGESAQGKRDSRSLPRWHKRFHCSAFIDANICGYSCCDTRPHDAAVGSPRLRAGGSLLGIVDAYSTSEPTTGVIARQSPLRKHAGVLAQHPRCVRRRRTIVSNFDRGRKGMARLSGAALLAGAAMSLVWSESRGQTPADAVRTVTSKVKDFTTAPRGEIDGAVLEDGTVIHWPPHLEDRFKSILDRGDRIRVGGRMETGPRGDTHLEVRTVTNLRSNASRSNDDDAPPPPRRGKRGRRPPPPPPEDREMKTMTGKVKDFTTAPRGEIDGAVLEDGTLIHWPPHLEDNFKGILDRGDPVRVTGWMETGRRGDTHLEIRTVTNLRTKALRSNDNDAPPPPRGARRGAAERAAPDRPIDRDQRLRDLERQLKQLHREIERLRRER